MYYLCLRKFHTPTFPTNDMRSYKPRHDTLWGYPRETQRLRPGTRHAHPRILKRCTGLALRLSGNAHTHHSSFVASRITHHPFVVCLPSLPHARLLCSSARPAVVAGRRCGAWRVVAAAARSARSPPAALLTASRVQAVSTMNALALTTAGPLVAGVRCARSQCRCRVQTPIAVTGGCFK